MGFQNNLNTVRNTRKTLLQLTMLTSIVAATALTTSVSGQDASSIIDRHRPAIPFCDDSLEHTIGRRLLYITTLDGRFSALDFSKGGKLRWSIATEPGPLISSSIHRLELTNNGQFVRMIPSLSGGIYKFDGEYIDPIPITTENLLSSSAKFSDDLVISGGKETRTYGVCARTGQLLYECSMHGCVNSTNAKTTTVTTTTNAAEENGTVEDANANAEQHDPLVDDVIVVRRQTQTVRAVESRTGVERWNFSVGQHELDLIKSAECHERSYSDMDMAVLDLDIKVIVPEGVICAYSKAEPSIMLWKYKFDHPIVSGWRIGPTDKLEAIDMFGSAQWLWNHDNNIFEAPYPSVSPSIYLGMYEKQLYIQESIKLREEIIDQSNLYSHLTTTEARLPKIPWRPIAASSNSLVMFQDDKVIDGGDSETIPPRAEDVQGNELVPYDADLFAVSAQSVLNGSEYVNGNGFFLYAEKDWNKREEALCDSENNNMFAIEDAPSTTATSNITNQTIPGDLNFNLDDIDAPVKVVILSLWFWWKEIAVIAFTSAVLLNLFIAQRQRPEREIVVIERHIPVPTAYEATESSTVALLGPTNGSFKSTTSGYSNGQRSLSESTHSSDNFSSRFLDDFDLLHCLGRGGFGVVFEAKNKLDDCKYAVKRITLPNKRESRDRVMREVKTLANCEHHNIVRYFQAWVETPPPGWQENEDNKWLVFEQSTSIQIETPDGSTLPPVNNGTGPPGSRLYSEKQRQLASWVSSVTSTACSSDHGSHCEGSDDDDDSYIVFRNESQSLALHEDDAEENEEEKEAPSISRKRAQSNSQTDAISIDIHSNSFDLSLHRRGGKNNDYLQLSNSFQIEFVRSAGDEPEEDASLSQETDKQSKSPSKRRSRPSSLELSRDISINNNCKALIPALVTQQGTPKTIQNKVYLYIQMQLCRKESLREWLRENKTEVREAHIASIFHQIVDAVDYVHLKGLIHRDLKPSNIFFSQDGQIKIGDFGLVTDMTDIPNMVTKCGDKSGLPSCARHTQQVGTHLYMSPEQLRGQHYDFKVDIYSLGLIFFELHVYFGTEMERIVTLRLLRDGQYPEKFPVQYPDEYELLKLMLSPQPTERPTTVELKQKLTDILRLPEAAGDSEAAALLAAAKRLSRSRTFSINE